MSRNKERIRELIEYAEEVIDSDGYAVIDVKLPSEDELYNPLSTGKNLDLNAEIYDFIDAQANIISSKIPLKIRFHGNVDVDRQEEIKRLMHRHYTMREYDVTWDTVANSRKTLFLSVLGVAVLVAYFMIAVFADRQLFAEILSIIGTFALWEAANAILLDKPALKRRRADIEQNINQLIEFVNDDKASAFEPAAEEELAAEAHEERESAPRRAISDVDGPSALPSKPVEVSEDANASQAVEGLEPAVERHEEQDERIESVYADSAEQDPTD